MAAVAALPFDLKSPTGHCFVGEDYGPAPDLDHAHPLLKNWLP